MILYYISTTVTLAAEDNAGALLAIRLSNTAERPEQAGVEAGPPDAVGLVNAYSIRGWLNAAISGLKRPSSLTTFLLQVPHPTHSKLIIST